MIRESFFVNKEISENIAKTIVDIPHGNSNTETFICLDYMGIGHKDKSFNVFFLILLLQRRTGCGVGTTLKTPLG